MYSTEAASLRRSLESARAGIQAAITEPAPTYRLAATWTGWTVLNADGDIVARLSASDRAGAAVEAADRGFEVTA